MSDLLIQRRNAMKTQERLLVILGITVQKDKMLEKLLDIQFPKELPLYTIAVGKI